MSATPEVRLQRIMHVEDEPDIQAVAKLALEAVGGFSVNTCSSGAEAVKEAARCAPDLILLDVMMPHMDGIETLARLRQEPQTRSIPVIFMTAKVQPQEIARLRELGAMDVLVKPFDPMTLADTIRTMWAHHQTRLDHAAK